jgi:uncharacterized membrane protein
MKIASLRGMTATKRHWPGSLRRLWAGSLTLNLFFIGVAVVIAIRPPAPSAWDPDVFVRIDRLATTLPRTDAALLRARFEDNRNTIENAQSAYRSAQDEIHQTLQRSPFDVDAMRAAMGKTRAERQNFDRILQGILAAAGRQMSAAGRHAMADGTPRS